MTIKRRIIESIEVKKLIAENDTFIQKIDLAATTIIEAYNNGKKLLLCGNGGSSSDAQHIAAELSGRYLFNRTALDAEALSINTSYLTAVSNDFGYDEIFARLLNAKGKKADVLIAISTSGNSPNIIKAINVAKERGMKIIGFTGENGGKMKDICDILLNVPSNDTPRIQESHILIGHIICEIIEKKIFTPE